MEAQSGKHEAAVSNSQSAGNLSKVQSTENICRKKKLIIPKVQSTGTIFGMRAEARSRKVQSTGTFFGIRPEARSRKVKSAVGSLQSAGREDG